MLFNKGFLHMEENIRSGKECILSKQAGSSCLSWYFNIQWYAPILSVSVSFSISNYFVDNSHPFLLFNIHLYPSFHKTSCFFLRLSKENFLCISSSFPTLLSVSPSDRRQKKFVNLNNVFCF